ncbi:hypothetical protein LSH36_63g05078 [Paralvinella palmiformis]|uniref:Fork-head domain-containing protein n=1 Tax=Paralvinella palmiformis TaxID=53620 RepID=A0AAD9NDN7_9ANNE|nr:hypothetical protein LSH36_63g05078 [Paralvinella palmiformis]
MWPTLKSDSWNVGQVDVDRSSPESVASTDSIGQSATAASGGEEIDSPPPTRNAAVPREPKPKLETDNTGNPDRASFDKPSLSYIALISSVIMSSPDSRMLLNDIYSAISGRYPYYALTEDKAWKNSIRHNLSLNECFIKSGRADNGKGNYWAIHPACVQDFKRGDFRRRQARRKSKRSTRMSDVTGHVTGYQSLPISYPYNVGYVAMNRMPTGCPTIPPRYQYGSSSPAAIVASTSSPFLTSAVGQLSPAMTSYAGYLHAHSSSGGPAPNINTAQLGSYSPTNQAGTVLSQLSQSQLVASQLGMSPQNYSSACSLYPSNSGFYPNTTLSKDNIQFR